MKKEIHNILKNNRKSAIKEFGNIELGIKKELNAELQEEAIIRNIISFHDEKEKLVKNLTAKIKRIKNNSIKKNFNELNKLVKNEKNIINKLKKHVEKSEKSLRNEIKPLNKAEHLIRH